MRAVTLIREHLQSLAACTSVGKPPDMSLYDGIEVETAPMPEISPKEQDAAPPAQQSSKTGEVAPRSMLAKGDKT